MEANIMSNYFIFSSSSSSLWSFTRDFKSAVYFFGEALLLFNLAPFFRRNAALPGVAIRRLILSKNAFSFSEEC